MTNSALQARVREALRQISAHDLQVLAEDIACIKYPERFSLGTLIRNGRNDEEQTTKNWPDAFVPTGDHVVDGIEATRERQSWEKHLKADLEKARDPAYYDLSGYVFVGGYPDHSATSTEIVRWINAFADVGVPRNAITILVGGDLVAELMAPQYAQVRQIRLGLPSHPQSFRLMGHTAITVHQLGLFQPTQEEFERGHVEEPPLLASVLEAILQNKCCLVRGYGAAGKTTLAQLVGRSPQIAPNPSWYLDVGELGADSSSALNDMVELAGPGVLFVLDNVHRNEPLAQQFLDGWRQLALPHGARLLMLGRKTGSRPSGHLSGLKQFELRAGDCEMVSVVSRLYRRRGESPPAFPQSALANWAGTFGGSTDPTKTAVDLIAFTAAVDRQLGAFLRGDFRLEPSDSIDAVQTRYLEPLTGRPELSNLLRLASLAKFEIGLYDELLADRASALRTCVNDLGIVIEHHTGLAQRRVYKLVHDALGELILQAAPNFEARQERILVSHLNPAMGLRMTTSRPPPEEGDEIAAAIARSVQTGDWLKQTTNVYDVASVLRYAIGTKHVRAHALDCALVQDGTLKRIINQSRSMRGVNALNSWLSKLDLHRSLREVAELAKSVSSRFHETILISKPSEVAVLIRNHPDGSDVLAYINSDRWSEHQAHVPPEPANLAVSAGRFFELAKRQELAIEPCRRLIRAADPQLWAKANISHFSHALRFAQLSCEHNSALISILISSRWLDRAYRQAALGPLCGALMSLSNYLAQGLHSALLTPELEARVIAELVDFREDQLKHAARSICLLGAYANLGGSILTPVIPWKPRVLEQLVEGLRQKNDAGLLGMHELEFWRGLRALSAGQRAPESVDSAVGERFLAELSRSNPPTASAANTKQELEAWLRLCRAHGWRLVG